MNKKVLFSILLVLLIVFVVVGSTYAYFTSVAVSNNGNVVTDSEKYEIIYNGGTEIDCDIKMLSSHVGADNTTVSIGLASGVSATVSATLFVNIEQISSELATSAFKWEIYRVSGNSETLVNSGNFNGKVAGNEVSLLTTTLSTTLTYYKVYFWLDGASAGNDVMGKTFTGYIGARTEILTGIVDNT